MPKENQVVSFRDLGGYGRPLTGDGIPLGEPIELCLPRFLIHECGVMHMGAKGWNHLDVVSPFWRLYYNSEVGHWIDFKGQKLELTPEQIMIVPDGIRFDSHGDANVHHLWLHFSVLPDYAFRGDEPLLTSVGSSLRAQIEAVIALQHDAHAQNREKRIYHSASALLHSVCAQQPLSLRALPESLKQLLDIIEHAAGDALSNEQMARLVGVSKGCFVRWFKQHIGTSPAAYVRGVRLDRACRLLALSDASIQQIAQETGFANRYHFSRAFAAHTGRGPAAFRDLYQKRFEEPKT